MKWLAFTVAIVLLAVAVYASNPTYGVPLSVQCPDGGSIPCGPSSLSAGSQLVVTGMDGGPVGSITFDQLGTGAYENLPCAPYNNGNAWCAVAFCNVDGGSGGAAQFAASNAPTNGAGGRHSLTLRNKGAGVMYFGTDGGVGTLRADGYLNVDDAYTWQGPTVYTGPVYVCCDTDGGCQPFGMGW